MATNAFKNVLPPGGATPDVPAAMAALAASIGQWVPVASRTEANQLRSEVGLGKGAVLVWRIDIRKFEVHPNTGASGEDWLRVSPPDRITSKDVWIEYTGTGGADDSYTIHDLFKEAFGKRRESDSGQVQIDLTANREPNSRRTFDTEGEPVRFNRGYNSPPSVDVRTYIAPDGTKVEAMAVNITNTGFHIRTTRPVGYNPGAITFTWIAVGEVGGAWNGGQ